MIESVELTNFRRHRNLKLEFGPGLNAIRGANEQGKTTALEAILYAIFGSDALRESLSEVVTDGENESTLRSTVVLTYDKVRYTCDRKKAGATVSYEDRDGNAQKVTGQRETKLFMENLFGCSAQLAALLMHADQNSVRGILAKGDTESGSLIERLAKLEAIDALIQKVQKQLLTGNTGAYEEQMAGLQNGIDIPETPSKSRIEGLTAELEALQARIDTSKRARIDETEVVKARDALQAINAARAVLTHLQQKQAQLAEKLAQPLPICDVTAEQIAQVDVLLANEGLMDKRRRAYATTFPKTGLSWDEGEVKFYARITQLEILESELKTQVQKLEIEYARKKAKIIADKTCALCRKDLSEVPEVVEINAAISADLLEVAASTRVSEERLQNIQTELLAMRKLKTVHESIKSLASPDYWSLLGDRVPAEPVWLGDPPPEAGKLPDVTAMKTKLSAYQKALAQRRANEEELAAIRFPVVEDAAPHEQLIETFEAQTKVIVDLEAFKVQKLNEITVANVEYNAALASRNTAIEREAKRLEDIEKLKQTIKLVNKHNSVIRNLRAARPKIVAELWGMLMSVISTHFTRMRGTDGLVSRNENGFTVNGRPIKRLSGSTQDILGLATRIALSKVFLPNVPFMFLDESFAGCDDKRELAGLNTLTVSGIPQTIFVTHSAAPESIADKLILI